MPKRRIIGCEDVEFEGLELCDDRRPKLPVSVLFCILKSVSETHKIPDLTRKQKKHILIIHNYEMIISNEHEKRIKHGPEPHMR